jgi:hypothetical protein
LKIIHKKKERRRVPGHRGHIHGLDSLKGI